MNNSSSSLLEQCGLYLQTPIEQDSTESFGNIAYTTLSALTQIVLLVVLFLRRRRLRRQNTHQTSDIESHLLPVHILFIRFTVIIYIVQAITINLSGFQIASTTAENNLLPAAVRGVIWGFQHFCADGVAVVLCQPGIGRRAVWNTIKWITPWSVLTCIVVAMSDVFHDYETLLLAVLYLLQTSMYVTVAFSNFQCAPCRQKRPAFHNYALTWIALRCMAFVTDIITYFDVGSGTCLNYLVVQSTFCTIVPWAIFAAFRKDTAFWFGYAYQFIATQHRHNSFKKSGGGGGGGGGSSSSSKTNNANNANKNGANDIRRPLLGLTLPTNSLEIISTGIESLAKEDIISFAELSIDVAQLLGSGGGAKVFKGTFRGKDVAFKIVFKMEIDKQVIEAFFNEAALLRRCAQHPNIVNLIGVSIAPPSLTHVLELCDCTLHEALENKRKQHQKHGSDTDQQRLAFFKSCGWQCSSAVSFLHANGILHRDIKSLNFLVKLGTPLVIKLADMDLAVLVEEKEDAEGAKDAEGVEGAEGAEENKVAAEDIRLDQTHEILGTAEWSAPEVLLKRVGSSTKAADVYALAVVCWECLNLSAPYSTHRLSEIIRIVTSGITLPFPQHTPLEIQQFLNQCWSTEASERPTSLECEEFFSSIDIVNVHNGVQDCNASKRTGSQWHSSVP